MKIGVFDSGMGGVATLKEIIAQLPQYDFIYLGDNARAPYGDRGAEQIYEFSQQAVDYLFKQDCGLVIVACNTVSSEALRRLQQEYLVKHYPERRILGVIVPTAESIATYNLKRIGVMGTTATIDSCAYQREIYKLNPEVEVYGQSCPALVPLIEADVPEEQLRAVVADYLAAVILFKPDAIVLACTHYSFLKPVMQSIVGSNTRIIDPQYLVAKSLALYLKRHPAWDKELSKNSTRRFLTTGDAETFKHLGSRFLEENIAEVETIVLK
ncbi:MAG: glutamate racemase [Candidatus Falkowbacteria bacterium]